MPAVTLPISALEMSLAWLSAWLTAVISGLLGLAEVFDGHVDAARRSFGQQLDLASKHGFDALLSESFTGLAVIAVHARDDATAATLRAAASARGPSLSPREQLVDDRLTHRWFDPSRERLGATRFEDALRRGEHLSRSAVIAVARDVGAMTTA